jgi:hypothetical protein
MRRSGTLSLALLLFCIVTSITANCERTISSDERRSVLAALTRSFGPPIDSLALIFKSPQYRIIPAFEEGVLVSIRIDANTPLDSKDLSRSDFDHLLTLLDSVKTLGNHQEDMGATFVTGGNGFTTMRYEHTYLQTDERIMTADLPHPVQSAAIYYIHPVTGAARFPRGSRPSADASSFGLIASGRSLSSLQRQNF